MASADSDGLGEAQLAAMAARLDALEADLRAQDSASREARAPVELDQQSVGRLSRMDAMQQQEMSQAEGRRRTSDLARISAARKRMEQGEYGWCSECGEAVALKRLEVDPMATRCIACAR